MHLCTAVCNSAASRTNLMPLPPPPSAALIMIGKPTLFANMPISSTFWEGDVMADRTGTSNLAASVLASSLSPVVSRMLDSGPITMQFACSHICRANSGLSERKP
ncbi:hypothetical protein KCU87_g508, partial [Aureobasidium melanogenum]